MEDYDFHYAMSLLSTMFGITLQEDMFEEIALTGWNMIGSLAGVLSESGIGLIFKPIRKSLKFFVNGFLLGFVNI